MGKTIDHFSDFFPMVFPMNANGLDDFPNLRPADLSRFLDLLEKSVDFQEFRLNVRQIERDFPCNRFVPEKSRKRRGQKRRGVNDSGCRIVLFHRYASVAASPGDAGVDLSTTAQMQQSLQTFSAVSTMSMMV